MPGTAIAVCLALLAALIVWLYAPALGFDFVWDDHALVVHNTTLRQPIGPAFWSIVTQPLAAPQGGTYYRPLQAINYWVDYQLWHLNPFWYRLESLLWHWLNSGLVLTLVFSVTRRFAAAVIASLIYTVHPAHVATIVYISGRADLLMVAALLGMVLAFLRRADLLATLLFLLAVTTKELGMIGLPLAMLLSRTVTPAAFRWGRALPLAGALAGYGLLRSWAITLPMPWEESIATVPELLWGLPWILAKNLQLLFLPHPSQLWFAYPIRFGTLTGPWLIGAIISLAGITAATIAWQSRPTVRPALIWGGVTLFAVLPFYAPVKTPVSEHWLVLPLIGFAWLVGLAAQRIVRNPLPLAAVLVIPLATTARQSLPTWGSDLAFFQTLLRRTPKGQFYANYAKALRDHGDLATSLEAAATAVSLEPDNDSPWIQLGLSALAQGNAPQAQWAAEQALQLEHTAIPGLGYYVLGISHQRQGRLGDAEQALRQALEENPTQPAAFAALARIYAQQERWVEARESIESALDLRPDMPYLYNQAAETYEALGEPERARAARATAERLLKRLRLP